MSAKRGLLGVFILLVAAAPLVADPVNDPQIIIRSGPATTIFLTGNTLNLTFGPSQAGCTFTPGSQTTSGLDEMDCGILNQNTFGLTNIFISISVPQLPLNLFCFDSLCSGTPVAGVSGSTAFFQLSLNAIGPGDDFHMIFVGFQPTDFNVAVNVPEPATMGLFAAGLGALAARRLRRRNRLEAS